MELWRLEPLARRVRSSEERRPTSSPPAARRYFLPAVLRVRRSRPYKRHDRVALNRHNVL